MRMDIDERVASTNEWQRGKHGKRGRCHPEVILSAFYIRSRDTHSERVDTSEHSIMKYRQPSRMDVLLRAVNVTVVIVLSVDTNGRRTRLFDFKVILCIWQMFSLGF